MCLNLASLTPTVANPLLGSAASLLWVSTYSTQGDLAKQMLVKWLDGRCLCMWVRGLRQREEKQICEEGLLEHEKSCVKERLMEFK